MNKLSNQKFRLKCLGECESYRQKYTKDLKIIICPLQS